MAPPSTPAQPRFLLPKSQKQKSATPLPSGSQQFASTPRFSVSKVHSHHDTSSHQLPLLSTPAPPTARARATQYEPQSDSIDTSPISSKHPRDENRVWISLEDSIQIESQSSLASPYEHEDESTVERPTKRNRISISPVVDATPEEDDSQDAMVLDDLPAGFNDEDLSEDHQGPILPPELRKDSEDTPSPTEPSTRHPTFLSAPRFKTSEAQEVSTDRPPLPEAFSPRGRGAKYVTGGLAAEVRDWLVQVKGASEYDRPTGDCVKLLVGKVRLPVHGGMYLVSGDEVESEEKIVGTQGHDGAQEGQTARVILAGDGRIAALGSRNVVAQDTTVSLYQPMWDIYLQDLGRFAVACDWEVENQTSQ